MPEILFLWERPPGRYEPHRGQEAAPTGGSSCPPSSPSGALLRGIKFYVSLRCAHHYTFVVPSASDYLLDSCQAAGNAMVGIYATGKTVVVGTIYRRGACGTGAIHSGCCGYCRQKIQALEIPALFCIRCCRRQLLEVRAFTRVRRIEMRVGSGRHAPVEAADGGISTGLESVAGAAPAWACAAAVNGGCFTRISGDEVVVQIRVVKLHDRTRCRTR